MAPPVRERDRRVADHFDEDSLTSDKVYHAVLLRPFGPCVDMS